MKLNESELMKTMKEILQYQSEINRLKEINASLVEALAALVEYSKDVMDDYSYDDDNQVEHWQSEEFQKLIIQGHKALNRAKEGK